jgi:hypothetical protein
LAQLFLKDDYDHDQEDREKALKDPSRHLQVEVSGDDIDRAENNDPSHDESSAGLARPNNGRVQQNGHEDDIDDLAECDGREWINSGNTHKSSIKYHAPPADEIVLRAFSPISFAGLLDEPPRRFCATLVAQENF